MRKARNPAILAFAVVLICTGICSSAEASFEGVSARVVRVPDEDHTIPGLELYGTEVSVREIHPDGKPAYPAAHIEGRMNQANWNLVYGKEWLLRPGMPSMSFAIDVKLESERTPFLLSAFDATGGIWDETITIEFSEAEFKSVQTAIDRYRAESVVVAPPPPPPPEQPFRRNHFDIGIGYTFVSYSESQVPVFESQALMPQLSYELSLLPNLGIGVDGFVTVLPINPTRSDVTATFWGWDGVMRVTFPMRSRFRVTLTGGMYYKSMLVSNNLFGFADMVGPELYPTFSLAVSPRDEISVFGRFLPTMDGFTVFSLDNHEIGFGATYIHRFASGLVMPISAEVSMINLNLGLASIQNNTYTLSLGFGI